MAVQPQPTSAAGKEVDATGGLANHGVATAIAETPHGVPGRPCIGSGPTNQSVAVELIGVSVDAGDSVRAGVAGHGGQIGAVVETYFLHRKQVGIRQRVGKGVVQDGTDSRNRGRSRVCVRCTRKDHERVVGSGDGRG